MNRLLNTPLFDSIGEASDYIFVFAVDLQKEEVRWSKAGVEFFGLPSEYLSLSEVRMYLSGNVHPDDLPAYTKSFNAIFSGESDVLYLPYRIKSKNGKYIWAESSGTVQRDEKGNPLIFAGFLSRMDGQASFDTLTGLTTNHEFYRYDFSTESGTVILFGIDGFRSILTIYGVTAGDELISELGRHISHILPSSASAFRMTGDEFAIVLPGSREDETEKLFNELNEFASLLSTRSGRNIPLTLTGGGVEFDFSEYTRDEIIDRLEITLAKAKAGNRGKLTFFTEALLEERNRKSLVRRELKSSIRHKYEGFRLFYQPWVDANTKRVVGCETLLRWSGKTIKDSYPGEFIPILEEEGDIVPVGYFILEEAIKQQGIWKETYGNLRVSINVSYCQFLEPDFVDRLKKYLETYKVEPEYIVLELTESSSVANAGVLADIFSQIRALGCQIALDDLGTAYSSMDLLNRLPVDIAKIECSFVRHLAETNKESDRAMVEGMLFLFRKLGFSSVVEGVENEQVDGIIREMDCDLLQGYYYSRPVPETEFRELLEKYNG